MILGILFNLCPQCNEGKVFSNILKMHSKCQVCGLSFEKESGYFLGAMSVGYAIGALLVIPVFLYLFLNRYDFWITLGVSSLQIIIQAPILFRLSRISWIYIDHFANQKLKNTDNN